MGPLAKGFLILSISSLAYTLVAPGRQTATIITKGWSGLTGFAKVTQGRG